MTDQLRFTKSKNGLQRSLSVKLQGVAGDKDSVRMLSDICEELSLNLSTKRGFENISDKIYLEYI